MTELQNAVNKMDVPPYKKDVQKGHNVEWLLANLSKRNAQHPQYTATMHMLLNYAEAQKMLKRTVIERYREQLRTPDVHTANAAEAFPKSITVRMPQPGDQVSSVIRDTTDGIHPPRDLLKVPKSGAPLYPHQESVLAKMAGMRRGEMLVIAGVGNAGRSMLADAAFVAQQRDKGTELKVEMLKSRDHGERNIEFKFQPGMQLNPDFEQSQDRTQRPRVSPTIKIADGKA